MQARDRQPPAPLLSLPLRRLLAAERHPADLADFLEDDWYALELPRGEGLCARRQLLNEDLDDGTVAHADRVSDGTGYREQLAAERAAGS